MTQDGDQTGEHNKKFSDSTYSSEFLEQLGV